MKLHCTDDNLIINCGQSFIYKHEITLYNSDHYFFAECWASRQFSKKFNMLHWEWHLLRIVDICCCNVKL